ncbi:MAG: SPL family radical SAM protein [Opitutales bacterium]
MFDRIYIEAAVREHPRTLTLIERYPKAERIHCKRYGEIFNPNRQNFRIQKQNPALILAEKPGTRVLPTPPEYGLGADRHYYFSHMLNCLYDCRYCFLQGMYQSANYILFVNFEDFQADIRATAENQPDQQHFFFSGYDCDSLAMDGVTGFADSFLPVFENLPNAWLELRTKSVNIKPLLSRTPHPNVVAAFSLNPEPIAKSVEHRAPPLPARINALRKLAEAGWKVGLRFDPLIHFENCVKIYQDFIDHVFDSIPEEAIHSITLGSFRSPKNVFKKMESLHPEEPLFMGNLELQNGMVSYSKPIETELFESAKERILSHAGEDCFFPCQ